MSSGKSESWKKGRLAVNRITFRRQRRAKTPQEIKALAKDCLNKQSKKKGYRPFALFSQSLANYTGIFSQKNPCTIFSHKFCTIFSHRKRLDRTTLYNHYIIYSNSSSSSSSRVCLNKQSLYKAHGGIF